MAKKRSGRFLLEEDRQLVQMAATSATLEEAAAIFRTSVDTIEKRSNKLGIQLGRRRDRAEDEEMRTARLKELEEMLARLLETARELPLGQHHHNALQEIARFHARMAGLRRTELRSAHRMLKAKGQ